MSLNAKNLLQAIKEVKDKSEKRNFTQSVELIINLQNIDLKKPENRFQERIELPHAVGDKTGICVIASGGMATRARRAGADLVIDRSELDTLSGDKKRQRSLVRTFDFFIAEAPLMPVVGRVLGSILGPRGKMPTPVPPNADVEEELAKHRKMVFLRLRGQPVLQSRVGTEKMADEEIAENIQEIMRRIEGKLKRGSKNISSVYLKLSMGKPVKVNV